jgi:hypothetical protein
MFRRTFVFPLLAVVVGLLASQTAVARVADDGTTEIPLTQVPKAVLEAVKKKFPETKPESASKGLEGNQPFYDVQIKVKSRNVWVTCDTRGNILSIDREISFQELPKAVAGAVSKKYPKAGIRGVNEIVEGSEAIYDLALTFNGKKLIAIFEANGKFVEESEDEEP